MKNLALISIVIPLFYGITAMADLKRDVASQLSVVEATVTSGEKKSYFHLEKNKMSFALRFSNSEGLKKTVTLSEKNYKTLVKEAGKIQKSDSFYEKNLCSRNSIVLTQQNAERTTTSGACIGARTQTRDMLVRFINLLHVLI